MPLDASIFLRGAQAQQQGWDNLNNSIGKAINIHERGVARNDALAQAEAEKAFRAEQFARQGDWRVEDMDLAREKMAMEKYYKDANLGLARQKANASSKGLDFDKLIPNLLVKSQMGIPLSEQEQAIAGAYDKMQMSERAFDPVSGGFIQKATPLFDTIAQRAQPQDMQAPMGSEQSMQSVPLSVELGDLSGFSPKTQQLAEEEAIKAGYASKKADREGASAKKSAGMLIDRLEEINKELKDAGGIVSGDQSMLEGVKAQVMGTKVGQIVGKNTNKKVETLRDEYKKIQNSLLPLYAKATGLGAKGMDTPAEQENIKGSFGDPTGIYESNKNQYDNIRGLFGVEGKQDSKDPLNSIKSKYNLK